MEAYWVMICHKTKATKKKTLWIRGRNMRNDENCCTSVGWWTATNKKHDLQDKIQAHSPVRWAIVTKCTPLQRCSRETRHGHQVKKIEITKKRKTKTTLCSIPYSRGQVTQANLKHDERNLELVKRDNPQPSRNRPSRFVQLGQGRVRNQIHDDERHEAQENNTHQRQHDNLRCRGYREVSKWEKDGEGVGISVMNLQRLVEACLSHCDHNNINDTTHLTVPFLKDRIYPLSTKLACPS